MSNYSSEVVPRLRELISCTTEDGKGTAINVAYVVAGPYGKSSMLVPDLWNYAKVTRSKAQGLYVQSSSIQVEMLAQHYASTDIVETMMNSVPRGNNKSKLGLVSYADFQSAVRDDTEQDGISTSMLEHQDMVLFVDVEETPTVEGEVTIGLLTKWIKKFTNPPSLARDNVKFTMVLLGLGFREDVEEVVARFVGVRPIRIRWRENVHITERLLKDLETETLAIIRSTLMVPFQDIQVGKPGPCILVFMQYNHAKEKIFAPLAREMGQPPQMIALSRYTKAADLARLADNKPKIICADPDFPISLALPNLRYVISEQSKMMRTFDRASQFSLRSIPLSKADIILRRSFVVKALNAIEDRPEYLYGGGIDWHGEKSTSDEPLKGQMMRLCLDVSCVFGNLWYKSTPVPALMSDILLIKEVKRRLHVMGCLLPDDARPLPTRLGLSTLSYITDSRFNRQADFHLGNLLARIETDAALSTPSKRVLIRIAALTHHRPVIMFGADAVNRLLAEDPEALAAIKEDSAGVGQREAGRGQIWTELGIWSKAMLDGSLVSSVTTELGIVSRAKGLVQIDALAAGRVQSYVRDLEERLGMATCLQELEDTMLSENERLQVLETLTRAYLHRLVFFPFDPPNEPPNDLISLQRIDIQSQPHPIPLASIMVRSIERLGDLPGGFCAVYQEITSDAALVPLYLTLLPNRVLKSIVGDDNLPSLLSTIYPVAVVPEPVG
ncbi:hypothetical protein F4820DRAFT_453007 [Hypoxylon rubiginosum]|uniref:Uncharacterized protein n=1 Tax=Hypoxylon rubiginosum TaxID=110542 RepID=A0ACB9YNK3_9PEZI|nr:hypothetical protein F4820DRAFT_453007 [Hypoxylon rubiginosum]